MADFFYKGRTNDGSAVEGVLQSQTRSTVLQQLKRQNIIAITVEPATRQNTKIKIDNPDSLANKLFKKKTVTIDELIMFSRQMYALTRSGIPLIRAIQGLSEASRSPVLSEVLVEITRSLTQGITLANSFSAHPNVFGEMFISMVRMGETTGRLDAAFKQLINHLELEKDTRKKIKSATRYPMIVTIFISLAMVVINVAVVPAFSSIFEKLGADLPLPTIVLIATSNFMLNYWWAIIIVLGGCAFWWKSVV